jgi:prolyl-tRNA synthetase
MSAVLTARTSDFPRWYQEVLAKAELADKGPVRGTMVIRPYAYAMWELMQADLDVRIKAAGAKNAYFPLLIPETYLAKETEHVEGFSPELAVVTHAGGRQLQEPLVVRPTSETVIGAYMAKWVQSYRDLPLLLNQWANVVRWELRPRPFLRTTEFLWQEGHTAHATQAEASTYARMIHTKVYARHLSDALAIPVVLGRKTSRERFAGATNTMTAEAMMGDGKALQMATSHELGQNFAEAFDITYNSADGRAHHAWTTSWGTTTRMIGGVIMCHGDDFGLRLPPAIAPVQVLVTLVKATPETERAAEYLLEVLENADVRVELDDRTHIPFGRRAVDAEIKGIPVRLEVGPRDLADGNVILTKRVDRTKVTVSLDQAATLAVDTVAKTGGQLFGEAAGRMASRTVDVSSPDEAVEACRTGWARIPWSKVGLDGEARLAEHGVTVRCLQTADGGIPGEDDEPGMVAVLARAY